MKQNDLIFKYSCKIPYNAEANADIDRLSYKILI